jgi:hypothetical protein
MKIVEVTRPGYQSLRTNSPKMRCWLDREGIQATDLHAVRVLNLRVTYSAMLRDTMDADPFVQAFGNLD